MTGASLIHEERCRWPRPSTWRAPLCQRVLADHDTCATALARASPGVLQDRRGRHRWSCACTWHSHEVIAMSRLTRALVPTVMACVAASGCTNKSAAPPPPVCSAPQGGSSAAQALASGDSAFAVALFQPAVTSVGATQNVIVSPYS